MNTLIRVLKQGWSVLRNEGLSQFLYSTGEYLSRINISKDGISVSYQTGTRVDFEHRWELLRERISDTDQSVLDIGCAEGHLTARFAESGLMSIGVERQFHTVSAARRSNKEVPRLGFLQYEITPDSVNSLPKVDIILLLTVYHHWVREYGWEQAEEMLQSLQKKCGTLFFEMPDQEIDRPPIPGYSGENTADYYVAYLNEVYDGDAEIEFLGETDYKGEDRSDLIFAISF